MTSEDLAASVLRRLGVRVVSTGVTQAVDVWVAGKHVARVTVTPAEFAAVAAVLDPTGTSSEVWSNGVPT